MATIKDVAREAGLTVTTVSRVLNNRGYISENARQKVEAAVKKLNYHPNELARSLQNKSSNTIGVIVPHILHPYFSEMISNLENEAYKKGYKILLCNSQSIEEKENEYIEMCTSNRVAGIILFSDNVTVRDFAGLNIPVITMERFLEEGTASVECDNYQGGRLAAQKLIDCGCRHLLHVGSINEELPMPADSRTEGFREVCNENRVSFIEVTTNKAQYNDMDYTAMLEKELTEHPEIDGLFANSDVIATQALQVCHKLHISVPKQLKVIGFDDVYLATLVTPQLTTIHQPVKEMAELAVHLLNDAYSGKVVAKRSLLPVHLVERETT